MKPIALLLLPALGIAATAAAQSARSPIMHAGPPTIGYGSYFMDPSPDPRSTLLPRSQQIQARLWQRVGQCVVGRDRTNSLAYVQSGDGEAAARLKPVFGICLKDSSVETPGNRPLRRAALADALGVPLPR